MKKTQIVTEKMLASKGACFEQVILFRRLFGASVKVTLKVCVKAASQFDWDWAARNLLSAPAWKAYQEAKATAEKAYQEAKAIAFARCVKEWGIEE